MWFCLIFLQLLSCVSQKPTVTTKKQITKEGNDDGKNEVYREIGRNLAGKLLGYYGKVRDENMVLYINSVGKYLASSVEGNQTFFFDVLNTDEINAFACPGGYILVTKGLIKNLNNEAELSMVLAHEISHITRNHMVRAMEQEEKELPVDSITASRQREVTESKLAGSVSRYLMSSGSMASAVVAEGMRKSLGILFDKGLDHELEWEADRLGQKLAIDSGYEPHSFTNFLKRLQTINLGKDLKLLSQTHPSPKSRREKLEKELEILPLQEVVSALGEERFLKNTRSIRGKVTPIVPVEKTQGLKKTDQKVLQ